MPSRPIKPSRKPQRKTDFEFIDLFAGIGGIRRAFESINGKCVFTSEWNKFAVETYRANFRDPEDHPFAGDITQVHVDEIPDHDVLLAGFPCQPFSLAGVSKKNALGRAHGFKDETQGTLFFDVQRIIEGKRPKAFLLENVKNLLSHDHGHTFEVIRGVLEDELGYSISFRVMDSRAWVPQGRQRIIIVGQDPDVIDSPGFDFDRVKPPRTHPFPRLGSILHPEDGSEEAEFPYTEGDRAEVAEKYTLTPKLWEYLQNYAAKHRAAGNGFGFGLVHPEDVARTISARYYKDGSEILVAQKRRNPRRLTPRECARLMGFDEVDPEKRRPSKNFVIPVSDVQAYKQFGNSVVVPMMTAIAKQLRKDLVSGATTNSRIAS